MEIKLFKKYFFATTLIAPLASFRIVFGAMMVFSTIRFWYLGWITSQYIEPVFHFSYYGFSLLPYPNSAIIYLLFIGLLISSLGIFFGFLYRISAVIFFITFNYIELLDKTYYLNHYYFVSLISLILLFVPAHKNYAIDARLFPKIATDVVPKWTVDLLKFQLFVVYFYAGIAKINSDWLLHAMPLKLWLPAHSEIPVIGFLLNYSQTAYVFSWLGMLFDVSIVFFMLNSKTRIWAYLAILIFHSFTGYLFQIGVFPLVMSGCMLIYFSDTFHQKLLSRINVQITNNQIITEENRAIKFLLFIYLFFQLSFPFRYLFYDSNLYWTEQGYRFSWRVMLVEKAGMATFYITDPHTGKEGFVDNTQFLNAHQDKQMAFQPDLILEYAHFLSKKYGEIYGKKIKKIRAEVYVTMNGRESKLLFSPNQNLLELKDSFEEKKWLNRHQ